MGLRLKGQMLLLCFVLFSIALAIVSYFNLSVMALSSARAAEEAARSTAASVLNHLLSQTTLSGEDPVEQLAARHEEVVEYLKEIPDLKAFELMNSRGESMMSFGPIQPTGEELEALRQVRRHRLPAEFLMTFSRDGRPQKRVDRVEASAQVETTLEVFAPLALLGSNAPPGFVHLSVKVPRETLKLKLVALINLLLSGLFLFTSLLAINLWGEHAINRPLRGLVEAMTEHFHTNALGKELVSSNELVNISKSFNLMALDLVKYQRELEAKTERLEALNEQLEQKVEDKTRDMKEFFSLVTHDLRIPLAAIQGYTDLLMRKQLDEKQTTFVQRIRVANGHALDLVRNLLEAMKYEFGKPQMVKQNFALGELFDEIVPQLSTQSDLPTLEVEIEGDQDLLVDADRSRIARVLTNLIGNAQRHSSFSDRVELKARTRGEKVELEVRDHGPGIPAEHLPLLFQKFRQFPSEAGPSSGLGLGLYIVGKIVEGHDSRVEVESELGEGTCFRFWLDRVV